MRPVQRDILDVRVAKFAVGEEFVCNGRCNIAWASKRCVVLEILGNGEPGRFDGPEYSIKRMEDGVTASLGEKFMEKLR